jgi:hypothetical protein
MEPATAATLPYRRRLGQRLADLLLGRPAPGDRRSGEATEHCPAIARGAVRPHSGRGAAVIDLREPSGDPIPERDRLLDVAPAGELRARGRAAALGIDRVVAG